MNRMIMMDKLTCPICNENNWIFLWLEEQVNAFRCMGCKASLKEMEAHVNTPDSPEDNQDIELPDKPGCDSLCRPESSTVINTDSGEDKEDSDSSDGLK